MDYIDDVLDCLDEMEEVMFEFEKDMNELCVCNPDDVELLSESIEEYKRIINEIFDEIYQICEEDESGMLKIAVSPECSKNGITSEYDEVVEKRNEINAIIYRTYNLIPMAERHLKSQMEKTLNKIRENNSGQSANAARYYNTVNNEITADDFHFRKRNRMI